MAIHTHTQTHIEAHAGTEVAKQSRQRRVIKIKTLVCTHTQRPFFFISILREGVCNDRTLYKTLHRVFHVHTGSFFSFSIAFFTSSLVFHDFCSHLITSPLTLALPSPLLFGKMYRNVVCNTPQSKQRLYGTLEASRGWGGVWTAAVAHNGRGN